MNPNAGLCGDNTLCFHAPHNQTQCSRFRVNMPSSLLTSILNGLTANPAIRDPDEVAQARIKCKIDICLCTNVS